MLGFNYIDIIIAIILFFNIIEGIRFGVWPLLGRLFSFFGALLIAFRIYEYAGALIASKFQIYPSFATALGFAAVFIVFQSLFNLVFAILISRIPVSLRENKISTILGMILAVIDGIIFLAIVCILLITLPVSPVIKNDVMKSRVGSVLVDNMSSYERYTKEILGGAIEDSLTFLSVKPESNERVDLPYKPTDLSVDEETERQMLVLVNEERAKVGAKALVMDPMIVKVARLNSKDMWTRGYFAHTNPDGQNPGDRMEKGGVTFMVAGENLALAPTLSLAHKGLMNSPGHKRNILDPQFGRVGIGVIDGGVYGKMFTQNFAD